MTPAKHSLPSAAHRFLESHPQEQAQLEQMLAAGSTDEMVRALCVVGELALAGRHAARVRACCDHANPKVRSKAVLMLGDLLSADREDDEAAKRLEAALVDADDRVRANAIEVLEQTGRRELAALLEARSRLGRNRERANAIKAMSGLRLCDPQRPLFEMLRDRRDAHRLSALWAVERTGQWKLLEEVARIARSDSNVCVRRCAGASVRRIAQRMRRGGGAERAASESNGVTRTNKAAA